MWAWRSGVIGCHSSAMVIAREVAARIVWIAFIFFGGDNAVVLSSERFLFGLFRSTAVVVGRRVALPLSLPATIVGMPLSVLFNNREMDHFKNRFGSHGDDGWKSP